ncbi:MAG: SprT-like domain-containing protein [Chlamydiales bacterium]
MPIKIDHKKALMLQERLENRVGTKLQLKINDNRSTMLSVKWEPDCTKVSLHRMFLQAPQNVMQALTCYLKGEHKILSPSIKAYIEVNLQKLDYSHELDFSKLQARGKVYNLQAIYDKLNRMYFGNSLKLHITWFGKIRKSSCNRITFGLYYDPLKLIKINRLLDHKRFPDYFIEYVVYHEMLHYACPTYVDENGQKHIHSKAFKARERKFKSFDLSQQWMRKNQQTLFSTPLNF